jgi:galactose oxidase
MPSTPVSAAVLRNGKVLTFASTLPYAAVDGPEQTHTIVLDPARPTEPVATLVTHTVHDMFCPGTAMLADGRLIVNGGDWWITKATSIYDATTDTWTRGPVMNQPRWYNSSLTLPSGDVFTLGGNRQAGYDGNGEIWLRATNTWKALPGARLAPVLTADPANRSHEHPRLFVAPNGRIFFAGPSRAMQWYDVAGSGSVTSAGTRADDEVSQNAITVMYDAGKILKAGGNTTYGYHADYSYVPSNRLSYAIDINAGSGPATVAKLPPMIYPRAYANGVVLPTGQVFVVGGSDHARTFTDDGAVLVPEMFDPRTRRWTELAPMATPRGYHSVAVLLPDGRVLVGGGGFCGSAKECLVNHRNIEIYSPPYLFAGTRPRIDWAPSATIPAKGGTFAVSVTGTVTGFTLVRMSSVTHGVNTDQRFLRLASTGSGTTRTVTAPANPNLAPPGYYMLFAMNGDVPSVAKMVRLG